MYLKNKCNQFIFFDEVSIWLMCCLTVGSNGEVWMDTTPIKQIVKAGDTTVLACSVENLGRNVVWMSYKYDSYLKKNHFFFIILKYPIILQWEDVLRYRKKMFDYTYTNIDTVIQKDKLYFWI